MTEDPGAGRKGEEQPKSAEPPKEPPAPSTTAPPPQPKTEPGERRPEQAAKPAPASPAPARRSEAASAVPPSGTRGPAAAAPPPKAPPPAAKRPGFLGRAIGLLAILVLVVLGVLGTRDLWWEWLPQNLRGSLAALAPRHQAGLAAVEERLKKLEQEAAARQSAAGQARGEQAKELAAVKAEVDTLRQGLEALTKDAAALGRKLEEVRETGSGAAAGGGAVPAGLTARLERLEAEVRGTAELGQQTETIRRIEARLQELAAFEQRIRTVEQSALASAAASEQAVATALAVDRLAAAVRGSGPFAAELQALRSTAAEDPPLAEAFAGLAPLAAAGVPTVAELYRRFPETAAAVVQAGQRLEGDGWGERVLNRLRTLVTVRRTGEAAVRQGGVDSVVAVAEQSLAAGDLAAAVAALRNLEGAPREAAAKWIGDAEARLAGERWVAHIQTSIVSRAGKSGS